MKNKKTEYPLSMPKARRPLPMDSKTLPGTLPVATAQNSPDDVRYFDADQKRRSESLLMSG